MCERERESERWGNVEYRTSKPSTDAVTSSKFWYLQHTKPDRGLNMLQWLLLNLLDYQTTYESSSKIETGDDSYVLFS